MVGSGTATWLFGQQRRVRLLVVANAGYRWALAPIPSSISCLLLLAFFSLLCFLSKSGATCCGSARSLALTEII